MAVYVNFSCCNLIFGLDMLSDMLVAVYVNFSCCNLIFGLDMLFDMFWTCCNLIWFGYCNLSFYIRPGLQYLASIRACGIEDDILGNVLFFCPAKYEFARN